MSKSLLQFDARACELPASGYAQLDRTAGDKTVLDFDAAADERAFFFGVMPQHYAGGDVVVRLGVTSSSGTAGAMVFAAAFDKKTAGDSLHANSLAASKSAVVPAPAAAGQLAAAEIVFTAAEIDGVTAGCGFLLEVLRNADDAGDTMAGDAELAWVELVEA